MRDNVHDPETVADVVQDTFARALERLPSLREPDRFRPWLLAIARYAAIDNRRRRSRTDEVFDREPLGDVAGGDPAPDELAELADLAELVRGCVSGLSPRDATALSLVGQLGLTPTEAATALGVSPATAKVVVHRARNRLRQALALEIMVRRRGTGCPSFETSFAQGETVAAARHVRDCQVCTELVRDEIDLYVAEPFPPAHA